MGATFVNKHGTSDWGLLALYGHKERPTSKFFSETALGSQVRTFCVKYYSDERSRVIMALLFQIGPI